MYFFKADILLIGRFLFISKMREAREIQVLFGSLATLQLLSSCSVFQGLCDWGWILYNSNALGLL